MDLQPLHQDNTLGVTNTTPHQERQKTCTRKSPCYLQGCTFCHAPTSHVRNLDVDLNSSDASSTPTISLQLPRPPADHPIISLTLAFHNAIQRNDVNEIEDLNSLYRNTLTSNLDFSRYDRSDLNDLRMTALNILNAHTATNTPLPPSPPNGRVTNHYHPSSLPKSPLTPGVVDHMTSTPG